MQANWVEKYRPKNFDSFVFQNDAQKQMLQEMVSSKNLKNLLFSGVRGTGKTTLGGVLLNELGIPKTDIMRVNCSDEKIDAIRAKVKPFALSMPDGDIRVVRLEEIDYLSLDAQALLRSFMEEVHLNCRFIATCNYPNRILPELRESRFVMVPFSAPNMDSLLNRVFDILDAEHINYSEDDVDSIFTIVNSRYPDIRSILSYLEMQCSSGTYKANEVIAGSFEADWKVELARYADNKSLFAFRPKLQLLSVDDAMSIFKFLLRHYLQFHSESNVINELIKVLAEHEYRMAFVSDPELNIIAMFIKLDEIMQYGD